MDTNGLKIEPSIRISPTQIEVIERCERLWYYDRVLALRVRTPSKSQAIGIDVENQIEAAHVKGTPPEATRNGKIAKVMLELLPPIGTPGLAFQQEFGFPVPIGDGSRTALVIGKKDLVIPGVEIHDFKTTKSINKWAKTPAQLMADIQSETYALDEYFKHGLNPIPLKWTYGQTEGAIRAHQTSIQMPLEVAMKAQTRAIAAATRMLELKETKPKAEDTKANIRACDMFGGCPHRAYCPARASKLSDFLPKENVTMGLKDKLKASLGIASEPAPAAAAPATPPPAPAAAAPPFIPPTEGQIAALGAETAMRVAKEDHDVRTIMAGAKPGQVNPPDALPSPDDQPKPAAAATEAAPAKEEKKPRGRPKKDAAAVPAEAIPDQAITTVAPPQQTVVKTLLVIDGAVQKGVGTPLEPLLRAAAELAAAKGEVPDWRLVEYGKGAGLLLVSFAELWSKAPPTGLLTVSSREPEATAVLAWLIDRADLVIKGV